MVFGYIRISTDKQTEENQKFKIMEFCQKEKFHIDKFISEQISSKKRRKDRIISELIEGLQPEDMIITSELSRLGRTSLTEVGYIIQSIQEKGAGLIAISEDIRILPGKEIDVKSQAILSAIMLASRIERDMISERTKTALAARKAQGVKLGRPPGTSKLEARRDEIQGYLDKGLNKTAIAKLLDVSRNTLYLYMKDNDFSGVR